MTLTTQGTCNVKMSCFAIANGSEPIIVGLDLTHRAIVIERNTSTSPCRMS